MPFLDIDGIAWNACNGHNSFSSENCLVQIFENHTFKKYWPVCKDMNSSKVTNITVKSVTIKSNTTMGTMEGVTSIDLRFKWRN